jgi:hypothetical protein
VLLAGNNIYEKMDVNLEQYPTGVYMLVVKHQSGIAKTKIIKQ